jgi:hypothetical protein
MTTPRRTRSTPADPHATLTPFDLMDAPELAALVVLEHAIEVAWVAVLAQHVDLLDPDAPQRRAPQPGAALTMPFFNGAHALTLVLRRYRAAVAHAAASSSASRDDAFCSNDENV